MKMRGKPLDKNQKKILKWHNELDRLEKRKGALSIALDLQDKMDKSIYDTKSQFYKKNVAAMRQDRIELENELEHSKKNIEDHWKKIGLGIDVDESKEKKKIIHKSRNEFLDNIPKRGITKTIYKPGEKLSGFPKKMGGRKKTRKKARKKRRSMCARLTNKACKTKRYKKRCKTTKRKKRGSKGRKSHCRTRKNRFAKRPNRKRKKRR